MEAARVAIETDLARCEQLLGEARHAAGLARGGKLLADLGTFGGSADSASAGDAHQLVAAWHEDRIPGRSSRMLVGTLDDVVVGLSAGTIIGRERIVGRIECCFVEPVARGVGVGGAMVTSLFGWFTEMGCSDVDAMALPGDRSMKQLFETAGFKTRLLVLHRSTS